jgi:dTDP-4-dehydrorhamnose reductase
VSKPAILLTGGSGQVGTGIQQANQGRFEIVAPGRAELDLSDPLSIETRIGSRDWAAIINCAAYTAVDKAESDREAAFAINAQAPEIIARAAAEREIPLLHVSTDYVFDGGKGTPYVEDDPVAPLGVYGASKEAGERHVRAAGGRHIILRTAWVVSPWGNNFVKTMLRLGTERDRLGIVADQIGCPTSAADIAETLLVLTERLLKDPQAEAGTYHFVNAGEASWFDLAARVFDRAAGIGRQSPRLDAIATSDYPTPAKRPANSRLATSKLTSDFGIAPRPWPQAIDEILDILLKAETGTLHA